MWPFGSNILYTISAVIIDSLFLPLLKRHEAIPALKWLTDACYAEPTEKLLTSEPQFEQAKPVRQLRDRTRPTRGGQVTNGSRNNTA